MPHLRCNGCGVVSYAPAGAAGACPECGVPWPRRPDEVVPSTDPERRLATLVGMTRTLIDVELAMLTEIDDERETVHLAAGGWPGLAPQQGDALPIEETFCRLMLEGRISNVVGDTRAHESTAELSLVRRRGVGAYLGVAVRPSDAELYVLCCLAREARPRLGAREFKLLSGLAESVCAELQSRTAPSRS